MGMEGSYSIQQKERRKEWVKTGSGFVDLGIGK